MGIPKIDTGPMTVEEFYAFTDARPDEEKWELIDGEPVLNAAPSNRHQLILGNIVAALTFEERRLSASWRAIPGIGARISMTTRPEPDVMILPKPVDPAGLLSRDTTDALVLFEIMSPSTATRDLKWKRIAYTGLAALTHYVVVAQDSVDVVVFARDAGFQERRLNAIDQVLNFTSLGVALALSDIYRDTGLA
jgi:Uma2 family endonuclease